MTTQMNASPFNSLPLVRSLRMAYFLSWLISVLMAAVSLGGLLFPTTIYPSDSLQQIYLANDVMNLLIGTPALLACSWLARRGRLIGLLCWPGALLYVLYNYIAYLIGMPVGLVTLPSLVLVLLCAVLIFVVLNSIDGKAVLGQLSGVVPAGASGALLVVFGGAFLIRAAGMLADTRALHTLPLKPEIGVLVADIVLSALWVASGITLLLRRPIGFASGMAALFVGCTLFLGLMLFMLVQPLITEAPFDPVGLLLVFVMGLVCFVPAGLFMRGVLLKGKQYETN
jgi:hypothetical protein